ncbi:MAG TPA: rhomboid family intramembrane serine protease [Casimicrobiaceae bacterium]|nr:rhomboid family intramembrane serine protease [Casimicrobiaceae bacterium]
MAMYADLRDPVLPDPARARANFHVAVKLALVFVAVLWMIQVLLGGDVDPGLFGVRPRQWIGLLGIFSAPLVHGDYAHLTGNSVPLVVLGSAMLYLYPRSSRIVLPAVYLLPGIAVWLFARGSSHIGASGLVYGMFAYVLAAGLLRRDRRAIATSLLVVFLYGTLVWGVLPIEPRMSWETHLAAAIVGVALAFALRARDVVVRRTYSWEGEPQIHEHDDDAPWRLAPAPATVDDPGQTRALAPVRNVSVDPP